jgi:hypothetical protein
MSIEPWINWQFHKTPGLIDPRATFMRASLGRVPNRLGVLSASPANTGRWRFNPASFLCEGLLIEPQRTNLLLRSEELDTAPWSAANLTVAPNATTAPDGSTTADTLTATATGGKLAQAVTITAGRGIAFVVFVKAAASGFAVLELSDGSNNVQVWFNLISGAVGSHTAGAGTLVYSAKTIEAHGAGWYRCAIEATSTTVTAIAASIAPAAADNTAPASTNSIHAWGAQLEAESTLTNPTSYIPTTTASVTRGADNLYLDVDTRWFNPSEGTMIFEYVNRIVPAQTGGSALVYGGFGLTFNDTFYLSRFTTGQLVLNTRSGGNGYSAITRPFSFANAVTFRMAIAWANLDSAFCLDGGTVSGHALCPLPATPARIAIGAAPWSEPSASSLANATCRAFQYFPRRLPNALLQTLTAP